MVQERYPSIEFGSIDELCSLVHTHTKGWDTKWYRGSKNPAYPLLPKLFRDPNTAERECYIAVEFRRRARSHLKGIASPFDWLCAMQHYSVPTRLLDWSESLAVALYFTVRPIGVDLIAPTIWVLDPFRLNSLSYRGQPVIPISTSMEITANADIAFDELDDVEKFKTKLPLPVAPDFIFNRLVAQNGTFTIHGTDVSPLEQLVPPDMRTLLLKFVARHSRVSEIYDCIDLIMPSSDAIFPDMEGLKDYIS